jgi:hypothetical protein
MNTEAPTITAEVTVILNDAVARELLSLGGVVEAPARQNPQPTSAGD